MFRGVRWLIGQWSKRCELRDANTRWWRFSDAANGQDSLDVSNLPGLLIEARNNAEVAHIGSLGGCNRLKGSDGSVATDAFDDG